jgi:precorrin-8X/cobalt-precorrin-8 methylmutase
MITSYERDGAEIYRASFATIRRETDLTGVPPALERVAVRMVHACGMTDLVSDMAWSADFASEAETALAAGAPVLCDSSMVAAGVTRSRLPARNEVLCTLRDPRVAGLAAELRTTRTAAAVELWRDHLDGALVAVGNAPTALFHLLGLVASSAPRNRRQHWPSIRCVFRSWWFMGGVADRRSRPRPSTRWRARRSDFDGSRTSHRRRGRPRRP